MPDFERTSSRNAFDQPIENNKVIVVDRDTPISYSVGELMPPAVVRSLLIHGRINPLPSGERAGRGMNEMKGNGSVSQPFGESRFRERGIDFCYENKPIV